MIPDGDDTSGDRASTERPDVDVIQVPDVSVHNRPTLVPSLRVATLSAVLNACDVSHRCLDLDYQLFRLPLTQREAVRTYIAGRTGRRDIWAYLQAGRECEGVRHILDLLNEALKELIVTPAPVVLLSFATRYRYDGIIVGLMLARMLRDRHCSCVVVGGLVPPLLSMMQATALASGVVFGNAEDELASVLEAVSGVNGRAIECRVDGHAFLRPRFSGIEFGQYGRIAPESRQASHVIPYAFVRGCNQRCAYCIQHKVSSFDVTLPDVVAQDIAALSAELQCRRFLFVNSHINSSRTAIRALRDAFLARGIDIVFSDSVHIDKLNDAAEIDMLAGMGAKRLVFGFETADGEMQASLGKRLPKQKVAEILQYASSLGVHVAVDVVCGFPEDSERTIADLVQALQASAESIDNVFLNRFQLIPGSIMSERPSQYGMCNVLPLDDMGDFVLRYGEDNAGLRYDLCTGETWEEIKGRNAGFERGIRKALPARLFEITNFNAIVRDGGKTTPR